MTDFKLEPHHVGALERCIKRLEYEADRLLRKGDYSAEFPGSDAESLKEVLKHLLESKNEVL